ncbi:MAG: hypothetical protein HRU09_18410 [Oligoflexales bacterium]|nr:hypothetical protein [Oligoflexales bacterium]
MVLKTGSTILNTSHRFFIEAVNDEFDEFIVDNTPSLIKIVEEVIESRIHDHGDYPISELIER